MSKERLFFEEKSHQSIASFGNRRTFAVSKDKKIFNRYYTEVLVKVKIETGFLVSYS
jgi:hypothetical protein